MGAPLWDGSASVDDPPAGPCFALTVGPDGAVFVTGFGGTNLFETFGAKLDGSTGARLWYRTYSAGSLVQNLDALSTDVDGDLFLTGHLFGTTDFGGEVGTISTETGLPFVAKVAGTTGVGIWARTFESIAGNGGRNSGQAVSVDSVGNVLALGKFSGTMRVDAPTGPTLDATTSDIYLLQLEGSTGKTLCAASYGGISSAEGRRMVTTRDSALPFRDRTLVLGGFWAGIRFGDAGPAIVAGPDLFGSFLASFGR